MASRACSSSCLLSLSSSSSPPILHPHSVSKLLSARTNSCNSAPPRQTLHFVSRAKQFSQKCNNNIDLNAALELQSTETKNINLCPTICQTQRNLLFRHSLSFTQIYSMCETVLFVQCEKLYTLHSTLHTHCSQHNSLLPAKICNDVFQSVRSVCNSSRCSPKITGRLSCEKSVNICANLVTVQSLRNFDSFFSLFLCLCFSLPPVNSLQVVESKIKKSQE